MSPQTTQSSPGDGRLIEFLVIWLPDDNSFWFEMVDPEAQSLVDCWGEKLSGSTDTFPIDKLRGFPWLMPPEIIGLNIAGEINNGPDENAEWKPEEWHRVIGNILDWSIVCFLMEE